MSTIYFISDLHLSDQAPETLADFLHFLKNEAQRADALYILGDLFEAWIGDDNPSPTADAVADALLAYQAEGKRLCYIHGNRDFLLGEAFATRCEMEILPDPTVVDFTIGKVILSHGDLLCTDDKAYLWFRRIVHMKWLQKLFLCLPLSLRQSIAGHLRKQSKASGPKKTAVMMDVNEHAAEKLMQKTEADVLIHGHTHKPGCHRGINGKRFVLGAWDEKKAILKLENGQFELIS